MMNDYKNKIMKKKMAALTGNKDVDILILDKLPDADLYQLQNLNNVYINTITELVFKQRIVQRTKIGQAKWVVIMNNMHIPNWRGLYQFLY